MRRPPREAAVARVQGWRYCYSCDVIHPDLGADMGDTLSSGVGCLVGAKEMTAHVPSGIAPKWGAAPISGGVRDPRAALQCRNDSPPTACPAALQGSAAAPVTAVRSMVRAAVASHLRAACSPATRQPATGVAACSAQREIFTPRTNARDVGSTKITRPSP